MFTDFVMNGQGHGPVGERIAGVRFDPGLMRPYWDDQGQACVTINTGRMILDNKTGQYVPQFRKFRIRDLEERGHKVPMVNSTGLRSGNWKQVDDVVIGAFRKRIRVWADLAAANTVGGFDGMANLTYEYETVNDGGEAIVDMDGLSEGRTDQPLYTIRSMPLPITHSDFWFSERQLAVSRNTGTPLDTTAMERAGYRIAESVEQVTLGLETGMTYGTESTGRWAHEGTSTIYGYLTHPHRMTKTDLTTPTGTNPEAVMTDILEMVETMVSNGFYGPWVLYHSTAYSRYLDDDYFRSGSTSAVRSLRERLKSIEGIQDIRRLDYLTSTSGFRMIMVQMTPDVARAIVGMAPTTVQWPSQGGLRTNFKTMCIMAPNIRSRQDQKTGIIDATTS